MSCLSLAALNKRLYALGLRKMCLWCKDWSNLAAADRFPALQNLSTYTVQIFVLGLGAFSTEVRIWFKTSSVTSSLLGEACVAGNWHLPMKFLIMVKNGKGKPTVMDAMQFCIRSRVNNYKRGKQNFKKKKKRKKDYLSSKVFCQKIGYAARYRFACKRASNGHYKLQL